MSLWSKQDNVTLTGTASIPLNDTTVTGVGTAFATEIKLEQMIDLDGLKFIVKSITSDTVMIVAPSASAAKTGVPILLSGAPRYLNDIQATTEVSLVTTAEAQDANNKILGVVSPGWTAYKQYTDANNVVRKKVEIIVAMKS